MQRRDAAPSRVRLFASIGCSMLIVIGVLGITVTPAGALSQHYMRMTQQLQAGVRLGCADVDWAAGQGLIEPVEVRWLSGAGVRCPNEQYEVMLALGSKGQLACADIEWNAANGMINWNMAAGLLWRTPNCVLTKYAFLVALAAQGSVRCVDVDWHRNVGLISPEQSGWLKAALLNQGQNCSVDFGTRANPAPKGYSMDQGDWWVRTTGWEPDVTAQVMAYNQFNTPAPPGYVYARLSVTATYKGTGTGDPWFVGINVVDQWSNTYKDTLVSGGGTGDPNSLSRKPKTFPGGVVTGAIYYLLPVGSAYGPVLGFFPDVIYSNVIGGVGFFRVN